MTATEERISLCFGNWLKTEFKVFVKFTFSLDNPLRTIVFKVKGAMDALNLSVVTPSALSAEQSTYILGDVHMETRLLGEISITSDMQMTPPLWQKAKN